MILTTVKVLYFLPDYNSILQELYWQTMDIDPDFPRIKKFCTNWNKSKDGKLYSVELITIKGDYYEFF